MGDYQNFFIVALVITILFFIVFRVNNKTKKTTIDMNEIVKLFNKEDIVNIDFVRNKIVVKFEDITKFDVELLHGTYAKGITIVGDKIKFYVSEDTKINEDVFNSIKKIVER